MANLTNAIPQLAQIPQCVLPAYMAIAAAGCGANLACICGNDNFFFTLAGVLAKGACTPIEAQESLSSSRSICAKAVPWLNDNRGPEIVATITILTMLGTIAVVLRYIARRISNLKFGADDWLIGVALLWSWGLTITQYFAVHNGFGKHILMLESYQLVPFTKAYFASTIVFPVSVLAIKLSVLFFYRRIFPTQTFRNISIVIGLVSIVWFIAYVFIVFFICIPLEYWWDKTIPNGHCINLKTTSYYGTSPPDILTNIAILVLPLPYLWNLQMRRAKKVAITFIFLLGSFATVGSIVRIPLLHELKVTDVSWSIVNPGLWLNVECSVGIISASLPVLRPLFTKAFTSAIRSRFSRSRTSGYGSGSQRLPDVEKGPRTSTIANSGAKADIYQGGGKGHKTWYNSAVSAMASKTDEAGSEGSQEEMVPMGKIAVRRDVDWQAKDRDIPVYRPAE